jgi:hypothetical protein
MHQSTYAVADECARWSGVSRNKKNGCVRGLALAEMLTPDFSLDMDNFSIRRSAAVRNFTRKRQMGDEVKNYA